MSLYHSVTYKGATWTVNSVFGVDRTHSEIAIGAQLERVPFMRRNLFQNCMPTDLLRAIDRFNMDVVFDTIAVQEIDATIPDLDYLRALGKAQLDALGQRIELYHYDKFCNDICQKRVPNQGISYSINEVAA